MAARPVAAAEPAATICKTRRGTARFPLTLADGNRGSGLGAGHCERSTWRSCNDTLKFLCRISLSNSSLESNSRAGWPSAVARAIEPAVGDRDQLDGAPGPLLYQSVTNLGQPADNRRRQTGRFEMDDVGARLMVQPRRIDRLLGSH